MYNNNTRAYYSLYLILLDVKNIIKNSQNQNGKRYQRHVQEIGNKR